MHLTSFTAERIVFLFTSLMLLQTVQGVHWTNGFAIEMET